MNIEFLQAWKEELESGKWKQAVGRLRTNEAEMCCLGVMCNMVSPNGWDFNPDLQRFTHNNMESLPIPYLSLKYAGTVGATIVNQSGNNVTVVYGGENMISYATVNDSEFLRDPHKPFKWVIILLGEIIARPKLREINIIDPREGDYITYEYQYQTA